MAGIKRKSTGTSAPEVKAKSKKVKVDKPTSKRESKHEVKPVKKSTKAKKEESSDGFEESDTSENENGFYGFSAAEGADVDMSDAESSEETEEQNTKSNGKTQKRKDDIDSSKKPKGDAPESKLSGLNCKVLRGLPSKRQANRLSSEQLTRSACEAKGPRQRTKSRQAKRGHNRALEEALGEA